MIVSYDWLQRAPFFEYMTVHSKLESWNVSSQDNSSILPTMTQFKDIIDNTYASLEEPRLAVNRESEDEGYVFYLQKNKERWKPFRQWKQSYMSQMILRG